MAKKVNVKEVLKKNTSSELKAFFESKGFKVEDGTDYGMTSNTLVVKAGGDMPCDLQVKLITPKTNVLAYEKVEEEA